MPQPPENIEREVRCPHCGELRTTKAQPNTNLRCRNCGGLFKVPRPGGDPPPVSTPPPSTEGPTEHTGQQPPGPGPKRVTPKIRPAPPPPPGEAAGDDGTAEGDGAATSPGQDNGGVPPAGEEPDAPEPPAEPEPEGPPAPAPEPEPEKPRGARRWRR